MRLPFGDNFWVRAWGFHPLLLALAPHLVQTVQALFILAQSVRVHTCIEPVDVKGLVSLCLPLFLVLTLFSPLFQSSLSPGVGRNKEDRPFRAKYSKVSHSLNVFCL